MSGKSELRLIVSSASGGLSIHYIIFGCDVVCDEGAHYYHCSHLCDQNSVLSPSIELRNIVYRERYLKISQKPILA